MACKDTLEMNGVDMSSEILVQSEALGIGAVG
jgi:hypothetical protein